MKTKTKVVPFTVTLITIGLLAGGAMGQIVSGTYDFADGATTIFSDTSQVGDAVWGDGWKYGQPDPALVTLGNDPFTGGDLAGSRVWETAAQFLGDGASGSASFDFGPDSDGAVTQGDRVGFSFLGTSSSFFVGFQAGVPNQAGEFSWDLVVDNGSSTRLLTSVGPVEWDESDSGVWFDLSFDYSITGGSFDMNYEINGFYEGNTPNLPHPNLGSIAPITGSSSHSVSSSFGSDTALQFGLTGEVASKTNTPNNMIDNLSFGVHPVPEPSSICLLGLGSLGLLVRRRK